MASTDARPVPQKNVAFRVYFPILDADGDPVSGAATLDSEVSKDGAAFADCTNEATEIGTSGFYFLDLTATEMNADAVVVRVQTGTAGAKTSPIILYPEEAGDIRVNVTQVSGDTTAADNMELMFDGTGYAGGTTKLGVDVVSVSGDATAADNLEADYDGTGLNKSNSTIGTVTAVAAGGITAASIATDAIDADALATDAVDEIVDAVWNENIVSAHGTANTSGLILSQLTHRALGTGWTTDITANSVLDQMADDGTASYDRTTDSLQAIRDKSTDIETDTQDIQSRIPAALVGGRIDSSVGAVANDAITAAAIANGAIDAATFAAGAIDAAAIATGAIDADALAADAANEIRDAVWAKAMTELASVPGVTGSVLEALEWCFLLARNKVTQTSTTQTLRNDADSADVATAGVSDDGTTFTRNEWA